MRKNMNKKSTNESSGVASYIDVESGYKTIELDSYGRVFLIRADDNRLYNDTLYFDGYDYDDMGRCYDIYADEEMNWYAVRNKRKDEKKMNKCDNDIFTEDDIIDIDQEYSFPSLDGRTLTDNDYKNYIAELSDRINDGLEIDDIFDFCTALGKKFGKTARQVIDDINKLVFDECNSTDVITESEFTADNEYVELYNQLIDSVSKLEKLASTLSGKHSSIIRRACAKISDNIAEMDNNLEASGFLL